MSLDFIHEAWWYQTVTESVAECRHPMLKYGSFEAVTHIGPPNRESVGYLDWVDIDDCIRYWVDKTARATGGRTARKKPRKRATIRTVRRATASPETPPDPGTKPPSPGGTLSE